MTEQERENIREKIFEISLQSARTPSKEIYIYELSSLSSLLGEDRADIVREEFLKNSIEIYQITNTPIISPFTRNDPFVNACMRFHYVPESVLSIADEVLIFDDMVAIYNLWSSPKFTLIQDQNFAQMQHSLFLTLWGESGSPEFAFEYHPPKSYYQSIDMTIQGTHAIIYADKDCGKAYVDRDFWRTQEYIQGVIESEEWFYDDADYYIIFLWNYEGEKMIDIWKYIENSVDTHSGPLSEARTYREGVICTGLGTGSGSTLLILGYEERLRRQAKNLQSYFQGSAPKLPFEMLIEEIFFTR